MRIHECLGLGSGSLYDYTQCDESVSQGDILVARDYCSHDQSYTTIVGFLSQAWPTAVTSEEGAFHAPSRAGDFSHRRWDGERASIFMARWVAAQLGAPLA